MKEKVKSSVRYGPRRRVVTLRLPKQVFFELSEWCEARGLSLPTYLEGVACVLSHQVELLPVVSFDSSQEVAE